MIANHLVSDPLFSLVHTFSIEDRVSFEENHILEVSPSISLVNRQVGFVIIYENHTCSGRRIFSIYVLSRIEHMT